MVRKYSIETNSVGHGVLGNDKNMPLPQTAVLIDRFSAVSPSLSVRDKLVPDLAQCRHQPPRHNQFIKLACPLHVPNIRNSVVVRKIMNLQIRITKYTLPFIISIIKVIYVNMGQEMQFNTSCSVYNYNKRNSYNF